MNEKKQRWTLDEQEFSFYNVRPNTAATYHQQKQITMESSVDENGGLDNRQCEAKQTGESTEAAPYYGYPMFMNRTMDHFGRSDQFRRWLHDDHLAKLNGNERQLELHRIGTDETYVDLLRKKFGQFQTRKARNNGFFMQ
ncbi:uncharacterized protein LOC134854447 isoform X2 [Symsagittifera roscoffensis]|uniref:uncharacterized protein LOC134854447 isoform X2 n=1 Tax=Symsagittifera roscoffensis TaxID=84072 RepID=UPI00307C5D95